MAISGRRRSLLPSAEAEGESGEDEVGAEGHEGDVEVGGVDVGDWGLVGDPPPHRLADSGPVALRVAEIAKMMLEQMQNLANMMIRKGRVDPVEERAEDDLQLVPDVLPVDLEVVLRVGEVAAYLPIMRRGT